MTLLLKCSSFTKRFVNNHSILAKFVLFIPFVLLLSCSKKIDVDQTDPKAVAKLYLSSIFAHKYEAAHVLYEPNFRKEHPVNSGSALEFKFGLKHKLGETPRIWADDISMEANIEGDKATVKARFTLKPDNSISQQTVILVQIGGKWWVSSPFDGKWSFSSPFEDYCQVVFEADYTLKNRFTDSSVQVKKGEKMLAGGTDDLDTFFYPTDAGVVAHKFSWLEKEPPHHFTCQSKKVLNNGAVMKDTMIHKKQLVVLHDVNLYADEELKQLACRLTAGTTLEKGSTKQYGGDSEVLHLEMDTLADICNGHSKVYFKLKKTSAGAASPLAVFLWKLMKK
jgi:hypothetical protein